MLNLLLGICSSALGSLLLTDGLAQLLLHVGLLHEFGLHNSLQVYLAGSLYELAEVSALRQRLFSSLFQLEGIDTARREHAKECDKPADLAAAHSALLFVF